MVVSYKEIRNRIKSRWKRCRNIWLRDSRYEYPEKGEILSVIKDSIVEEGVYQNYTFDCDDFALQLSSAISVHRGIDREAEYPWPFGQVMGRKFKGKKVSHTCNICLTEKDILLIEPQTDAIWQGHWQGDDPYFVIMP